MPSYYLIIILPPPTRRITMPRTLPARIKAHIAIILHHQPRIRSRARRLALPLDLLLVLDAHAQISVLRDPDRIRVRRALRAPHDLPPSCRPAAVIRVANKCKLALVVEPGEVLAAVAGQDVLGLHGEFGAEGVSEGRWLCG